MTTAAPPKPVSKRQPNVREPAARPPVAQTHLRQPAPTAAPTSTGRVPKTLFQVSFASAMKDGDIALLARTLDLTTHMHPKPRQSPTSPGLVRLDHHSGLFLERGAAEGDWVLEARTWGLPAALSIHEWHVLAAGAARLLDPGVSFPERPATFSPEYPMRPLGRAANKRSARIGRRILGL
jgi:hypothetical protein